MRGNLSGSESGHWGPRTGDLPGCKHWGLTGTELGLGAGRRQRREDRDLAARTCDSPGSLSWVFIGLGGAGISVVGAEKFSWVLGDSFVQLHLS